ncbi:MAG: AAA family ATPase [Candidatus Thermoplasmatota archaeon]|nr:AAA family ATPase [Candidatus Thermoplasmatota archaeon]
MAEGGRPAHEPVPINRLWSIRGDHDPVELADRILASPLENLSAVDISPGIVPALRIESIRLDGFGPHDGPNVLKIEDGLTLVTGRNGTGKTHIILGVHWCLFGERGSLDPWMSEVDPMGRDLVNWERIGTGDVRMSVEVTLTWNGKRFTMRRELNGKEERFSVIDHTRDGDRQVGVLPEGLEPGSMSYLLFQGEAVMFLASEDPFLSDGNLRALLSKLSGADRLRELSLALVSARKVLFERLSKLDEVSAPKERELASLQSRSADIDKSIEKVRSRILSIANEKKRAFTLYRRKLRELSGRGDINEAFGEVAAARARLPLINGAISHILGSAGRELLHDMAGKALDSCMKEREERTRRRMKVGAMDAQASIIRRILDNGKCMCGTPVGRTGTGRERIGTLLSRIEDRKAELSTGITEPIWSSDQVMEGVRRCLAGPRHTRGEFLERIEELEKNLRTLEKAVDVEKTLGSPMDELISVVRDMERNTTLLDMEKDGLKRLMKEKKGIASEKRKLEAELARRWGVKGRQIGFTERIDAIDKAVDSMESSSERIMESLRAQVEEKANIILSRLDAGSRLGMIRVHGTSYRIGRTFGEKDKVRVLPMAYLSAGERELAALSVLASIPGISGGMLLLDSPFPYMDSERRKRMIEGLPDISTRVLISLPEGGISREEMDRARSVWRSRGLAFRHYMLEMNSGGSILRLARSDGP